MTPKTGSKRRAPGKDRPGSIPAKRAGNRIGTLRQRAANGEDISGKRGYMRLGVSNTAILAGADDLKEWDEEELIRGQRRNKNGRFTGRPPEVVPHNIHEELVRRTLKAAKEMMRTALVPAVTMLGEIIGDPDASDKDKLTAASMIIDRMMGKAPERLEVTADMPEWMVTLTEGIVSLDDEDDIIDVDSEEVDDDEDGE